MKFFRKLAAFLGLFSSFSYAYPAQNVELGNWRSLHLVGSIHMGTKDMSPLPHQLAEFIRQADAIIVEADITQQSPLDTLLQETEYVPLSTLLSPEQYRFLLQLCKLFLLNPASLETQSPWRVAMILQSEQAKSLGLKPEYGIDYQLLNLAHQQGKKVIELEGANAQMTILKNLPDGGLLLLQDTLDHWHTNARALQIMISWWLSTSPKDELPDLPALYHETLYNTLILDRNIKWSDRLQALPKGRYVVVVGALHLYGKDNLLDMLLKKNGQ